MFEEKLIDFDTLSRKLSLYFIHLMKISKGEINNPKIIEILVKYENNFRKQSEYYVIHKKFKKIHLINKNYFSNFYFKLREKYATGEENKSVNSDPLDNCFFENYEKLSKNDWKLHKKYVKKGHNPNEIAKIIRNDEIEKLQEISSQLNFDFNQKIKPSLYERYSFINQENVTLIDYAAFFSAVKCFKYLLMNDADIYHTFKYAVAGGNLEIIHLCEQNHSPFEGAYETAIEFHRNDIFQYLYENKLGKIYSLEKLGVKCVLNNSYQILSFLIEKANLIKSNTIIHAIILSGNLFLMISLFGPYNFENIFDLCIKSQNVELVEYFFKLGKIDVNELLAIYFY